MQKLLFYFLMLTFIVLGTAKISGLQAADKDVNVRVETPGGAVEFKKAEPPPPPVVVVEKKTVVEQPPAEPNKGGCSCSLEGEAPLSVGYLFVPLFLLFGILRSVKFYQSE
jgi:MYXO-CTERM domain-containing protein